MKTKKAKIQQSDVEIITDPKAQGITRIVIDIEKPVTCYDMMTAHLDRVEDILKEACKKKPNFQYPSLAFEGGIQRMDEARLFAAKAYETLGVRTAYSGNLRVNAFKTEEEINKVALNNLYDRYKMSEGYISETLDLLFEMQGRKIDLPNICSTLNKMMEEMVNLDGIVEEICDISTGQKAEEGPAEAAA